MRDTCGIYLSTSIFNERSFLSLDPPRGVPSRDPPLPLRSCPPRAHGLRSRRPRGSPVGAPTRSGSVLLRRPREEDKGHEE